MEQKRLTAGPLLNADGILSEAGYATSLVKKYDRNAVKGGKTRIKEWDYYLIYNDKFGVALTLDDNSYMGMVSASFLDFEQRKERTVSPMSNVPLSAFCSPIRILMKVDLPVPLFPTIPIFS